MLTLIYRCWLLAAALLMSSALGGCAYLCLPSAGAKAADLEDPRTDADRLNAIYLEARLAQASGNRELALRRLEECRKAQDCPPAVYAALAELHFKAQELDKAQDALDEGLKRAPNDVGMMLLKARVLRQRGRMDEAMNLLNQAMALQPHRQRVLEELSELHIQRLRQITTDKDLDREVGDLIKVYEHMLEGREGMERVGPLLVLSSLYLRTDNPGRAVTMAEESVAINPREIRCYLALGSAQEALKKPVDAIRSYKQALLLDPSNQEVRGKIEKLIEATAGTQGKGKFYGELAKDFPGDRQLQLLYANSLFREKQWAAAEKELRQILKQWPDEAKARVMLVHVLVGLKRTDEAIAEGKAVTQSNRELAPLVTLTLAEGLVARGDRPEALRLLTEANQANRRDENVAMALASLLIDMKKPEEAIRVLQDFLAQRPDFFMASVMLVQAYADQNHYDKAQGVLTQLPEGVKKQNGEDVLHIQADLYRRQKNWTKALEILGALAKDHPDSADYTLEIGTVYQELGRNGEAEQAYLRAIKLGAGDAETYNTLGYFYADTNQKLDEALKLINKALALKPNAGHILDSLGWVYYQRGDYATAVEKLSAAIKLMESGPDPVVYEHLGDAYAKLGKLGEARQAWNKALSLAPDAARVREKLAHSAK